MVSSHCIGMTEHSSYFSDTGPHRYHALDNLRAILLLLLLVLHASVAYMVTPLDKIWPFKDSSTNIAFDVVVAFIHAFRLPLLFAMAGFFGGKLYSERGPLEFLRNRLKRIAIPLIVFWVVLAPLILAPFALIQLDPGTRTIVGLASWLVSSEARSHLQFFHLWFLFDLLLYYGAVLLFLWISKLTCPKWRAEIHRRIGLVVWSPWGLLLFVALTATTLLPMKLGILETPATFERPLSTLIANSLFFLFGWGLFIRRDLLDRFTQRAWFTASLGVAFFLAHLVCVSSLLGGGRLLWIPSIIFASLAIWHLIYGIMGLFLRYCNMPSRLWRYISDSSYWCFLVHLPLIVWLQILMAEWKIPSISKFAIVLAITTAICLLTYDRFVRHTRIGILINGRRRPRHSRSDEMISDRSESDFR